MIACPRCAALHASTYRSCPECGFLPAEAGGFVAWAPWASQSNSGFKAEYFAPLAAHEDRNFWFVARNQLILWALETYCAPFDSFLEIGCGTGLVLAAVAERFPATRVTGCEALVEGLAFAAARAPDAHFVQMDACSSPYVEEFDVAGAFDVIEHIDNDEAALWHLHRALKPGGKLLISVPQHGWLWSAADSYACHRRRYSARELHGKVRRVGFEVQRSTSFVSLLLPAMLISRRSTKPFDPLAEFKIHAALNETFKAILACERRLVTLGVNFPIAGSRLVIAEKRAA